jgi:replication initiation protein RepC
MSTYSTYDNHSQPIPGGRIASDALRASRQLAADFCGLEEGADRYGLLLLVKRVGKIGGFTPRMIQLLDYYVAYTRDVDWEEGSRPVVYQSLSRAALDLGVSERQVQKLEAALFSAGAITWNDSGNHKRYGQRCTNTGRIVYAFGVDLTPLAYLRGELERKLQQKRAYDDAWMAAKRAVSTLRREFRGLVAEWLQREEGAPVGGFVARYEAIAVQIRTHLDLTQLESIVGAHRSLVSELEAAMGIARGTAVTRPRLSQEAQQRSCTSEPEFAPYKYTNHSSKVLSSPSGKGLQKGVADGPAPGLAAVSPLAAAAMEHVSLAMAVGAASERLQRRLPTDPDWADLVEATYAVRGELGVSQASWSEACEVLGRPGAAVCLLVADRAALREFEPVRTPPAYFRGMVRRAERGELRLCRSLFGLLERDAKGETCAA